ncbi:MAG: nitronate monooxygenase [Deltaproteobacteria bacterium]|nr:nitronate monooxygenase [Deltaproteobacteria bacterium]
MKLPPLKIKNIEVPYPIIQGGMGVGISWDNLAGNVAKNGCIGIISGVCTGYRYPDFVETLKGRPLKPANLHHRESLIRIVKSAKEIAGGNGAVGVNILHCITEYGRVVKDAVDAGADLIITGAGIPLRLPEYAENPEIALVPIVSSARVLKIICKSWKHRYNRLPDAVVMEGPKSGGHQGYTLEQCRDPQYALEKILPEVLEEAAKWGEIPVIAAGGIWDRADIESFLRMGAAGVQMATRFIGTYECDASPGFKQVVLNAGKEDIALMKSPVGYPARGVISHLQKTIEEGTAPKIECISNCIVPCNHGEKSRKVGYCIADRLSDAVRGDQKTGLFFSGSNGWRVKELVHVKDLIEELTAEVPVAEKTLNS